MPILSSLCMQFCVEHFSRSLCARCTAIALDINFEQRVEPLRQSSCLEVDQDCFCSQPLHNDLWTDLRISKHAPPTSLVRQAIQNLRKKLSQIARFAKDRSDSSQRAIALVVQEWLRLDEAEEHMDRAILNLFTLETRIMSFFNLQYGASKKNLLSRGTVEHQDFLAHVKPKQEENLKLEAPAMTSSIQDQLIEYVGRFSRDGEAAIWTVMNGYIPAGDDVLQIETMTIEAAKFKCRQLLGCVGFTHEGDEQQISELRIWFKSKSMVFGSGWTSYLLNEDASKQFARRVVTPKDDCPEDLISLRQLVEKLPELHTTFEMQRAALTSVLEGVRRLHEVRVIELDILFTCDNGDGACAEDSQIQFAPSAIQVISDASFFSLYANMVPLLQALQKEEE